MGMRLGPYTLTQIINRDKEDIGTRLGRHTRRLLKTNGR